MTQLNPYLSLGGRCREAMTFYQDCLGGELTLMTVGESPMAAQMPDQKDDILHAQLSSGSVILMGTDCAMQAPVPGNTVALSLNFDHEDEITAVFAKLADGGHIHMPLGPQFWGATFGSLTDKFGNHWMLNYQKNTQEG